jgi:hypothetical protein
MLTYSLLQDNQSKETGPPKRTAEQWQEIGANILASRPMKKDKQVQFKQDFDDLNQTIAYLRLEYKKRCKKDPKLAYPAIELDELQESNNLKFENQMAGVGKPIISASLTAVASSNCRLQSGIQKIFSSSIYRANCLRAQASYVLNFKELHTKHCPKPGKRDTPLNNPKLYNEI